MKRLAFVITAVVCAACAGDGGDADSIAAADSAAARLRADSIRAAQLRTDSLRADSLHKDSVAKGLIRDPARPPQ